ncbi:hypothetical protein [Pontibacter indicus]|nr:hypothetical protein [Pontibacter indicus]
MIKTSLYAGVTKVRKGQVATVGKIISHQQNPDVAIFGSSVAWVHFNPEIISNITGRSSYNFGLNGTPLTQYQGLLKEFIEYSDSEVIVIAGTFSEFSGREAVAEIYRFTPYLDNYYLYEGLEQIDPNLLWKMKYVPFYPLTTLDYNFFQYAVYGYLGRIHHDDETEVNGFVPQHKIWRDSPRETSLKATISNKVVQQYKALVSLANARNKKVVLVLPPIYYEGVMKIENLQEIKEVFQSIAGTDNYFLDYTSNEICLDKSLFYNNTHLNSTGADIFSEDFSNKLSIILKQ